MDNETIEAAAAQWIVRRYGETWTDVDERSLDSWLGVSTFHRVSYLRLDSVWQQTDRLKALGAGLARATVPPPGSWGSRHWRDESKLKQAQKPRALSRNHWAALAASVILGLLACAYWFFIGVQGKPEKYATAVGGLQTFRLADGSQVTLNTNTHLRAHLQGPVRRVELDSGEAFFVVARDASRPFVVSAADKKVTAVGTEFSVRRTASDVQVLVSHGRVELSSAGSVAPPTALNAGSLARTVKSEVLVEQLSSAEVERLLNWRSGFVEFQNASLPDAVAEIGRYHARKLVSEDPALASIRISGKFRTSNLDAFLTLLQQGFPVTVETTQDEIILKRR